MIDVTGAVIGFFIMLGLMFVGLHVATAMFLSAALGALIYLGPAQILAFGTTLWAVMNDFILTAIPLFILLGELLMRSGVTHRMYDGLSDWLSYLPGGLLHSNIGASALFASVSGSSVATAATIGTVALPELEKRHYNERLALGSIAAGATLGILIPPSVNMIIYGALTKTSIGKLFIAGIIPGLTLTVLFMATILVLCVIWPSLAGREAKEDQRPLRDKLARLRFLLPPLMIFVAVMGSIYFGWATPSEAAAIGVLLSAALAAANGHFKIKVLHEAFVSTVRTSALILFIIIAAFFLNFIVGILGIPQALTRFVAEVGATPATTIWLLSLIHICNLFHIGILLLLGGHAVGLLTPHGVYAAFGLTAAAKQMLAITVGGIAGAICFIGMTLLLARRLFDPRVRKTGSAMDTAILLLLYAQLILGLATLPVSLAHADGATMLVLAEWAQRIVTFRGGAADLLADVHWIFKLHIIGGLTVFLLFPFSRLVHIWSAPVWYLGRKGYQIVRER